MKSKIQKIGAHTVSVACMLLTLLFVSSCNKNETNPDVDVEYGEERHIELPADFSDKVPTGEVVCHLQLGNVPVVVKSEHTVERGKSVISFDKQVRIGKYILKSVIYRDADHVLDEINVGCTLDVSRSSNAITPSTYDPKTEMFGSGTAEDPYLLATSRGFVNLRGKINPKNNYDGRLKTEGLYFRQVANIEKSRQIALSLVKCVLAVAGLIFTGGTATASMAVCSFALNTAEEATSRNPNSVEISQCCNFGTVSAGNSGYGIVAQMGDYVFLEECVSIGASSMMMRLFQLSTTILSLV